MGEDLTNLVTIFVNKRCEMKFVLYDTVIVLNNHYVGNKFIPIFFDFKIK